MTEIRRRKPLTAHIGVVGVGHHTYWSQFEGLREELLGKLDAFVGMLDSPGIRTTNFGLVDEARSAAEAAGRIVAADVDLLFIDMLTYATSATFAPIALRCTAPIVLVALQPAKAMDYQQATTYMQLCNDDFCSVPEFTGVAARLGRPIPPLILGTLTNDPVAEAEIDRWLRIACALHDLRSARLGLMGHVLEAMLDMHVDPTAVTAAFGAHVVLCEPDDIVRHYRHVEEDAAAAKRCAILEFFATPDPVSDPITEKLTEADLTTAARVAAALEAFIEEKELDGLAYYYEGEPDSETRQVMTNLIVGNSMLCAQGFPMCGEYDLKTCIAMLIMDRLGIGGSFAEFHPIDFERDSVLVGHDGPHHLNIADGRPVLRSLRKYHGKPGSGASVEFRIKQGPVTMLGIGVKADGSFKFIIAEGESIRWPIPPTGNTNTHGRFPPDVRTFLRRWVAEGPTHHFALGIGHHAADLVHLAECLDIESAVVTSSSG